MKKVITPNSNIAIVSGQVNDNDIVIVRREEFLGILVNARGYHKNNDYYYCGEFSNNNMWASCHNQDSVLSKSTAIDDLMAQGFEVLVFESLNELGQWLVKNTA